MNCPRCGADTHVVDSRLAGEAGVIVRRRRVCGGCDRRFTTHEIPTEDAVKFTLQIDLKGKFAVRDGTIAVDLAEDETDGSKEDP